MSSSKPQICCPNPGCTAPLNSFGSKVCEACKTPLLYRYLWAAGKTAEQVTPGTQIAGRYFVTAPQIWLDTQPGLPPDIPSEWPEELVVYLYLYPQRLHTPEVYGVCPETPDIAANSIFLLENVPIDTGGLLQPAIDQSWPQATAVRQVYWLWQLLQLWSPLYEQGIVASLLAAHNIRVEGWRIRLCQFYRDIDVLPVYDTTETESLLGLADLANLWLTWVEAAKPEIQAPLREICQQMQLEGATAATISSQLNHLLLQQASRLPLRLQIVGATDPGPERSHNEDTCYPLTLSTKPPEDGLAPRLAIVCDGIGGHEGGEVASQLAVQSFKLQVQALLAEVAEQRELISPELLAEQLEASVRVVNNLIATQNDTQGREDRRRMGTTLVMALQLPQRIPMPDGTMADNGHELYLINVGDSRAYWITQRYCQRLTVDDDVAAREVRMGRSLHWEGLQRPDAGALTQALGTRDADFLHPTIQRLILEEDGILLLCSDGLSDNDLVEQFWSEQTSSVLKGKQSLDQTARALVDLANQKNGYDNTSVVLLRCHVSSPMPEVSLPGSDSARSFGSDWFPASRALAEDSSDGSEQSASATQVPSRSKNSRPTLLLIIMLGLVLGGTITLFSWSRLDPQGFQQFRERVLPQP